MFRRAQNLTSKALLAVLCYSAIAYSATGLGLVELQERAGISTGALGLVGALALAAGLAGELLLAPLADRGRVRLLATASAASATTGLLALAVAENLALVVTGKALIGVSLGIAAPLVMGEAARNAERKGRALAITAGIQMAAHSLGAFGAAAALRPLGVGVTFTLLGASGIAVTMVAARTTETARHDEEKPPRLAFDLLKSPAVIGALLLGTAFSLATGVNGALWDRHVTDTVATSGADPNVVNGLTYLSWTFVYLATTWLGGKLADGADRTRSRLARHAYLPVAVTTVTYGLAYGPVSIVGASALNGAAEGLLWPLVLLVTAAVVPEKRSSAAQSLSHACISLGGLVVAGVTPAVYAAAGAPATYTATAGVMLLLGGTGAALLRRQHTGLADTDRHTGRQ